MSLAGFALKRPYTVASAIMLVCLLAFGAVLLWSWLDQRLRCRTCLRRLDLPVYMGVLGASLFDPTGVESVCPVGHGALYEPDTGLSDAAWITLDEFFSTHDR